MRHRCARPRRIVRVNLGPLTAAARTVDESASEGRRVGPDKRHQAVAATRGHASFDAAACAAPPTRVKPRRPLRLSRAALVPLGAAAAALPVVALGRGWVDGCASRTRTCRSGPECASTCLTLVRSFLRARALRPQRLRLLRRAAGAGQGHAVLRGARRRVGELGCGSPRREDDGRAVRREAVHAQKLGRVLHDGRRCGVLSREGVISWQWRSREKGAGSGWALTLPLDAAEAGVWPARRFARLRFF